MPVKHTLITLDATRCDLMLTLCTGVGTPNLNGPFRYFEKLNSGLEKFRRIGALNIAFAALHALDSMIN